ncbi:ammonia-dependent NAD(+) synthetase [Buchnera aphidicola (Taiwanaphis decaspermi)]|uniref:ammonia-dependent NAD(+) synthetase n=1 Tax=Buchnera aphidicola TaxID=9 RepID=UPI0031B806A2
MKLQQKIVKLLNIKKIINPKIEIKKCIDFICNFLYKNKNIKSLITGVSGGIDSTLTAKLCQKTVDKLNKKMKKNYYKFIAVRLPYGIQKDEKDVDRSLKFIKPNKTINVNIKNAVMSSVKSLQNSGITISDYVKGNEKARERMKVQYSIASMKNGVVVGTSNASEYITGFFTKYGDGGTDINPIMHLNKKQCVLLLKKLKCSKKIYTKIPIADLEEEKPNITDEEALGVSYEDIDSYLENKFISNKKKTIIEKLYLKTLHKRDMPINLNIKK